MRKRKSTVTRISAIIAVAGVLSFTLTGAIRATADRLPCVMDNAGGCIKKVGELGTILTIPVFGGDFIGWDKQDNDKSDANGENMNSSTPQDGNNQGGDSNSGNTYAGKDENITSKPGDNHSNNNSNVNTESDSTGTSQGGTVFDTSNDSSQHDVDMNNSQEASKEDFTDVNLFVPPLSNLISMSIGTARDDLKEFCDPDGPIEKQFFAPQTGPSIINLSYGQINNCTVLDNETVKEISCTLPEMDITLNSMPQVLIMHTHTTESYATGDGTTYDKDYNGRSLCPANSVVGIGAILAQKLAEKGICVIHDGTVHDDPVYSNSYSRSNERVNELLKLYPSIKIVLDIHRDGIAYDGVQIAPVTEINGKEAAQVMIICGADDGSGILPDFEENLKFAGLLQSKIEKDSKGITRPMLFDYRYYNQDLTTGSLLIEFGTVANTPAQARYSAELVGESIAQAIIGLT